MARMSDNDEYPSRDFGDSLQLTNFILDSRATVHMTTQVSDLTPGSLEDTDKKIEAADGHQVTAKKKEQVLIIPYDDKGDTFIVTLHNVFLAPDPCNKLLSISTSMNLGNTCLFHKGFCMF